ncbi:MAG: caspase family protein [Chitinophagaceae bacterium]
MINKLAIFFILLTASLISQAQEKRALLIAIDKYVPPVTYKPTATGRSKFTDLNGCVNDARSMQSIIVSKFQFNPSLVDTIYNEAANRSGILKQMNALLEKSKPNDIAFIFYAGHGSHVPNSLSKEADKIDETIVPSDTWKPGVEDIRDKELAKIFNHFVDKGVKLTVITDCCHSGSLSRGPQVPSLSRFIEDANYDAKDASSPVPPETRKEGKFLILSAAQDNELAQEQRDEFNISHGAFTIALMQALDQQSVNASVINLFTSIRAILKSNGKKQEPVLGSSAERQQQTLFGITKGTLPDKSRLAVSGFDNGRVILQGGFALGLYKENELVKIRGKDTIVKLRVDTVLSVNRSMATIIKGTAKDVKAGELFEVSNWVSSSAPLLKLYIPSANLMYSEVTKLAAINKELQQSPKIKWINELEKTDPYTSLFFDGEKFKLNIDGKDAVVPKIFTTASILQICKPDSSFYFELPPSNNLAVAIKDKLKSIKSIFIVNNPAEADYILYGTVDNLGKPAYGFRRAQTAARDSLESMPVQTKNFTLEDGILAGSDVADSLYEYAMRLSKIRGWMQLSGPKGGESNFPFHFELVNTENKKVITTKEYTVGDKVAFHLVANSGYNGATRVKRYVYVFMIDKQGNMLLGYPDAESGNVANQFPKFDNDHQLVKNVLLFEGEVSDPVGTDNYILLASDEPIANYSAVLNQEGVRGAPKADNPLSNLLNLGNEEGTRGFTKSVSNWNLIRLSIKSRH